MHLKISRREIGGETKGQLYLKTRNYVKEDKMKKFSLRDILFFFGLPLPEEETSHQVFMTGKTRRTFLLSQLLKEA